MFHGCNTAKVQARNSVNSVSSKIDTCGTSSAVNLNIFIVGRIKISVMHRIVSRLLSKVVSDCLLSSLFLDHGVIPILMK